MALSHADYSLVPTHEASDRSAQGRRMALRGSEDLRRQQKRQLGAWIGRGRREDRALLIHIIEEVLVALGIGHFVQQEDHRLVGVHVGQQLSQNPDAQEGGLGKQQFLASGP